MYIIVHKHGQFEVQTRMKRENKAIKNIFVGGMAQLIAMAISLFVPRMLIMAYGSDANGLVSTISQAFTYIALLEAGIGNAALVLLYKNIAQKDADGLAYTLSATRSYFRRLIPIYALCVAGFAAAFPFFAKTGVEHSTIRWIILIQGMSGVINFGCINTHVQLLTADGRNYIITGLDLMAKVIISLGQIILISLGMNIIVSQMASLAAMAMRAIVINIYVRRVYPDLKLFRGADIGILKQRKAMLVHEITSVIFSCTDVFIISIFCGTALASVYAVYELIYSSLNSFIRVIENGFSYKFGHIYNADIENYPRFHDGFEAAYSALVFAVMSATLYLTLPFVSLYTSGVTDANYIDPLLPLLFALVRLLSCSRVPGAKLIIIAGHVPKTIANTIIEAILNLGISLALVQFMGIYGVLLGTIAALLYRSNDIIFYANRKILSRMPKQCYITHGAYFAIFALNYLLSRRISLPIGNYGAFLLWGCIVAAAMMAVYGCAMLLVSPDARGFFFGKLLKKRAKA